MFLYIQSDDGVSGSGGWGETPLPAITLAGRVRLIRERRNRCPLHAMLARFLLTN